MKNIKKNILTILIAGAMITGGGGICANAEESNTNNFETWYVSANSGLNCRTEPTTEADNVIKVYPKGSELQIIGIDTTGKWWETWDGETQGWCHSDYLRATKEKAEQTAVQTSSQSVQTSNMRYIGDFKCTTYTPDPTENGGGNYTSCGDLLTDVVGYAIAVDPSVIPYGTRVYIKDIGYRVARDCGGAIKGNRIDVLAWSNTMDALGGYNTHEVYIVD